jgi:hypothetical protein
MHLSTLTPYVLLVLGATAQSGGFTRSCIDWTFANVKQGSAEHGYALEGFCGDGKGGWDPAALHIGDCVGVDLLSRLEFKRG